MQYVPGYFRWAVATAADITNIIDYVCASTREPALFRGVHAATAAAATAVIETYSTCRAASITIVKCLTNCFSTHKSRHPTGAVLVVVVEHRNILSLN